MPLFHRKTSGLIDHNHAVFQEMLLEQSFLSLLLQRAKNKTRQRQSNRSIISNYIILRHFYSLHFNAKNKMLRQKDKLEMKICFNGLFFSSYFSLLLWYMTRQIKGQHRPTLSWRPLFGHVCSRVWQVNCIDSSNHSFADNKICQAKIFITDLVIFWSFFEWTS